MEQQEGPLLLIVVHMSADADSRFAFDAARLVTFVEARGVPPQSIKIRGLIRQKASAAQLGLINDTQLFGLTTPQYERILREYYVEQDPLEALNEAIDTVIAGPFSCLSVILFNHGGQDGAFGRQTISQEIALSTAISRVLKPTFILSSTCFATILFRSLAQTNQQNVVRMYDFGTDTRYSFSWGIRSDGELRSCGTYIAHELLCAIQQSDCVSQVGDALCKLHAKSCHSDACHPRIEGQSALLCSFPFFGKQKVHMLAPHWISIPANALVCKDPNIFNWESTRPGVRPSLVKLLDDICPPPEFWDATVGPAAGKVYKDVSQNESQLEMALSLCAILRAKGLLDDQYPGGVCCYSIVYFSLYDAVVAQLIKM